MTYKPILFNTESKTLRFGGDCRKGAVKMAER